MNCVRPARIGIRTARMIPPMEAAASAFVSRFHGCVPISMPRKLLRRPISLIVVLAALSTEGICSIRALHEFSWNLYSASVIPFAVVKS